MKRWTLALTVATGLALVPLAAVLAADVNFVELPDNGFVRWGDDGDATAGYDSSDDRVELRTSKSVRIEDADENELVTVSDAGTTGDVNVTGTLTASTVATTGLDAELQAIAGLTSAADKLPYFTGSETAAVADFTAFGRSIVDDADEATFKATVNLEPGTDVQAYDADLSALAGLTSAADKGIQFTGSETAGTYDLTTFAKTLLDDGDLATVLGTLQLTIGTNVQAWDADLDDLADGTYSTKCFTLNYATLPQLLIDSSQHAGMYFDRGSTSYSAQFRYMTGGTSSWRQGLGSVGTNENWAMDYWNGGSWDIGLLNMDATNYGLGIGTGTSTANARLEVEDGDTAHTVLTKFTADNHDIWTAVFGNDTYSTTDTNGLRVLVSNDGTTDVDNTGGVLDINALSNQAVTTGTGLFSTGGALDVATTITAGSGNKQITNADGTIDTAMIEPGTSGYVIGTDGTTPAWKATTLQTIMLWASSGTPRTSNGCAEAALSESTTNKVNTWTLDFDSSTDEYAFWDGVMPYNWGGGTCGVAVYWMAASGTVGHQVSWNLQAVKLSDDDAVDSAFGTVLEMEDTLLAVDDQQIVVSSSPELTITNASGGDRIQVQVFRDVDGVTGTNLGVDAKLIGIRLAVGQKLYTP